jgi:UDP:flavonoid glycosyltransferase YjiC (YdhE family)
VSDRHRILFVAENVTLAQVVRLATLARSLDPARYEAHFACSEFAPLVFDGTRFVQWTVYTIPRWFVDRAIRTGRRIYDKRTLRRYVTEELELFEQVQPHLVVGDLRQSLAISAPLRGVPHANLINAYWSPHAERASFPLPDHRGPGTADVTRLELLGRRFSAW